MGRAKHIFRTALFLLAGSASSCFGAADLGNDVHVIFEICRPKHSVEGNVTLGYQSISDSGYGGIWLAPRKKSDLNEPVYYSYGEREPRHIAMVARFLDSKENRIIFMRPKNEYLKLGSWSPWLAPNSVTNDERVEGKILRNIDFNKSTPEQSLAFVRYKLMTFRDYLSTVKEKSLPLEVIDGGKCGE